MNVSGRYIHRSVQTLDSGIQLDLLQEYIFIILTYYFKILQNNIVENETDAWLMFLGTDSPDQIISLLEQYPWFEDAVPGSLYSLPQYGGSDGYVFRRTENSGSEYSSVYD